MGTCCTRGWGLATLVDGVALQTSLGRGVEETKKQRDKEC